MVPGPGGTQRAEVRVWIFVGSPSQRERVGVVCSGKEVRGIVYLSLARPGTFLQFPIHTLSSSLQLYQAVFLAVQLYEQVSHVTPAPARALPFQFSDNVLRT